MEIKAGIQERSHDDRDIALGAFITLPAVAELPITYEIAPLSIKDQNAERNEDFCAAYSGAGSIEPKEEAELFPPFLFAAAKFEAGVHPNTWGLQLRDVGQALVKWGVPEKNAVSNEVKELELPQRRVFANYPETLRKIAAKHKAMSYAWAEGPYDFFDNVRATMWKFRADKKTFIFGSEFGWPLDTYFLTGSPKGFGHAMWIAGWTEQGLLCVQSAGMRAGRNGMHVMDRETFNRNVQRFGAMTVVDLPKDEIRDMLFKGIKDDDNWLKRLLKNLTAFLSSKKVTVEKKIEVIKAATEIVNPPKMETNSNKLYKLAIESIGTDVSPRDIANDEYGCVESVTTMLNKINPNIPVQLSTLAFLKYMRANPQLFKEESGPAKERIVICATGTGNGKVPNGHVGICVDEVDIMSNTSATGKWEKNYTKKLWDNRFVLKGGYKNHYFYLV